MSTSRELPAGRAFVTFFQELREVFLERETLFTQIELALLAREHVLVTGPPGTAKSAIASAVLSRIHDERSGKPSLFAKQLSESTVQTDLIGPVDFKVLTETGRTEYLTEDGMLGAAHAFLDEVFDGRDMLLRSILNVLHERELKEGRRVTAGQIECALMTTNRYLSEVLARSPELLLAFADRLSFVCFVPKGFARRGSRAAMLARASKAQRPVLRASLSLQQLDALQLEVEQVRVEGDVLEAVEQLSDELERELLAQVSKLPDYVPTKYFSQRSVVKALWALKAAVVRDRMYQRPTRALVAEPADLEALRHFFLLGGPPPEELEALLASAADPRERAQLEIIRLEHQVFDAVLARLKGALGGGLTREAAALAAGKDLQAAQKLQKTFVPAEALALARELKGKLRPGPRHPENRPPLVAAARLLVQATSARLSSQRRALGAEARASAVFPSAAEVLGLAHGVPELADLQAGLVQAAEEACGFELGRLAHEASAPGFEDGQKWEALCAAAQAVDAELKAVRQLAERVGALDAERGTKLVAQEQATRERAAAAVRAQLARAFRGQKVGEAGRTLEQDSRRLAEGERAVVALWADAAGLRAELLEPLAREHVRNVLRAAPFSRIEQLTVACQQLAEALRQEGLEAERLIGAQRELLEARLREYSKTLSTGAQAATAVGGAEGEAHLAYRKRFGPAQVPDGETLALRGLEERLLNGHAPAERLSEELRRAVAQAELDSLGQRVRFLTGWYAHLQTQLPAATALASPQEADKAFDRLVRSRFPLLTVKEGELARLLAAAAALKPLSGELGQSAGALESAVQRLAEDFGHFSKQLLDARVARGR